MLGSLAKSLFGNSNDRAVKRFMPQIEAVNALETSFEDLDDAGLKAKAQDLRTQVEAGTDKESLLAEAFALVREAAKRALGQRHFDVQLMGGIALHNGQIAEMKTGEGKTLVATLASFLNALDGKGVHVVTVNDYLASRDAAWMGKVYEKLGLSVGCIVAGMDDDARRAAYHADITYGTNNEFGFDYLRDNLKFRLEDMVQRDHHFAIVDEVDSILIDEARTPLIISGPAETNIALYTIADAIIPDLIETDFDLDEKGNSVSLTEDGIEHAEVLLKAAGAFEEGTLYDINNVGLLHHVNQALRAHKLFQLDTHYMLKGGLVVIIDEFTGRAMDGRRFSDGLHQAIEAKEKVEIQAENQTLASVTFQNYFRMYEKLAGMTGTALTEAGEFSEIYNLDVTAIPTNRDIQRIDHDDEVYRTGEERDAAVIDLIIDCQTRGQPVLVGTISIEKSESLSKVLTSKKIKHQVLNARFHEEEARIIAQAGVPGAVTIATNMAGRGTDIQLGGNLEMRIAAEVKPDSAKADKDTAAITAEVETLKAEALAAGGLYVICTERHESRRIDNQLRGRTGRQGDPGASKFFLSLQDDLMRIFGSEKLDGMLQKLGLEEGEAIIHPWINKAVEKAQTKVEARNFEIRKQLLKYDDVMNDQRSVIFDQRKEIMRAADVQDTVSDMRREAVATIVANAIPQGSYHDQWDADQMAADAQRVLGLTVPAADWFKEDGIADPEIEERLIEEADKYMAEKAVRLGPDVMRMAEKSLLLQVLDQQWKEHLLRLDQLRQGISLRAYAQKDPLNEYKREAFDMFEQLLSGLRETTTMVLAHVELRQPDEDSEAQTQAAPAVATGNTPSSQTSMPSGKVARNAPCPCGSGKKYKHCHGKI
ncbi:preprotein translocase subunit SecA [Candidatus Puniceispirillum marinum]|uniref:Protein translocase subunit SecA n=1 Tax=Puniceispirillum marinum (strain IMCC1322) TaxID=488538 RepID=D5BMX4_PUNMI|nr:preprotein translocase subunit SecA [Candidatus Puniceispirillum marinum]ADE40167.1 Preprotein translocase subunit SecA [Candidatus Puniceispirillum marinum IMCC1322]